MFPDYKNWIPRSVIILFSILSGMSLAAFLISSFLLFSSKGNISIFITLIFFVMFFFSFPYLLWSIRCRQVFSYDGKVKLSKKIIDSIASRVELSDGMSVLDVGCGSGALSIAIAKKNDKARVVGVDRWDGVYASFSKQLCIKNAEAEGVTNVEFVQGDARCLPFKDESFDVVVSNYVYHNIPSKNRQDIVLETLRCLKKGGAFAIHDIMSRNKYGDTDALISRLRSMGYEDVRILNTSNGFFFSRRDSIITLMLNGSKLLIGRK